MKGKYAIKASNRAAAIDNEVIAEMRAKLESAEERNRDLEAQIAALKKAGSGAAMREANRIAALEIERLEQELASKDAGYRQHLDHLAFSLLDLYAAHDCQVGEVGDVDRYNAEYASLFGMSDRFGELIDHMHSIRESQEHHDGKNYSERLHNRKTRRQTSTARKLRKTDAMLTDIARAPGRFGVGVKPGQRLYYGRAIGNNSQLEPPR